MCSRHVPKGFPKFESCSQDASNSTSVLSHIIFLPKFSPMSKLKMLHQRRAHFSFILVLGVQRGAFLWGVPNVPKKIGDRPINMALSNTKKRKKKEKKTTLGEPPFTISFSSFFFFFFFFWVFVGLWL